MSGRRLRASVLAAVAVVALAGCTAPAPQPTASTEPSASAPSAATPTPTPTPTETVIEVSALGDMLPHQTILDGAQTADGWDFAQYFSDVTPVLESSGQPNVC